MTAPAKLPHLGVYKDSHIRNEPPLGLLEDLRAMGQVEPNLDLRIPILPQRELVDMQADPQGPLMWHQAMLLGTVEMGQVPYENGQVGQGVA